MHLLSKGVRHPRPHLSVIHFLRQAVAQCEAKENSKEESASHRKHCCTKRQAARLHNLSLLGNGRSNTRQQQGRMGAAARTDMIASLSQHVPRGSRVWAPDERQPASSRPPKRLGFKITAHLHAAWLCHRRSIHPLTSPRPVAALLLNVSHSVHLAGRVTLTRAVHNCGLGCGAEDIISCLKAAVKDAWL